MERVMSRFGIAVAALLGCICMVGAGTAWAGENVHITAKFTPNKLGSPTNASGGATIMSTIPGEIPHADRWLHDQGTGWPDDRHQGHWHLQRGDPRRPIGTRRLPEELGCGLRRRHGRVEAGLADHRRALHAELLPRRQPSRPHRAADVRRTRYRRSRSSWPSRRTWCSSPSPMAWASTSTSR